VSGDTSAAADLGEIAAAALPLAQRAPAMLEVLGRLVPHDGAWLALADPGTNSYATAARADLDDRTVRYLCGPETARDIDLTGTNRDAPPLSPSDLPYAVEELTTWAQCLIPAGFHESLSVALFAPGGRHVGFLTLLSGTTEAPPAEHRHRLGRLTSVLAHGIDPMRSLLPAARLVQGATAGVVLRTDGGSTALPGLEGHAVLDVGSPPMAVARSAIESGSVYTSFLWPLSDDATPAEHVRVTALACPTDAPAVVTGMVLLSPPGEVHGLTPRELQVLGRWRRCGPSARASTSRRCRRRAHRPRRRRPRGSAHARRGRAACARSGRSGQLPAGPGRSERRCTTSARCRRRRRSTADGRTPRLRCGSRSASSESCWAASRTADGRTRRTGGVISTSRSPPSVTGSVPAAVMDGRRRCPRRRCPPRRGPRRWWSRHRW
jgi:hypothetical protein